MIVKGEAELVQGQYVSGDFFSGLAVVPAAGRLIHGDDDRAGAAPVAVLSAGYSQRRFGDADRAIGQAILVNSVTFTVVGVAPPEFFGVDPASAPQIYLPMRTSLLLQADSERYLDQNYYWVEMMGRLKPGVDLPPRPGGAGGAVRAVGRLDGDQRSRARQSSCAATRGGRGGTRQPEASGTRSRCTCCWRWWG